MMAQFISWCLAPHGSSCWYQHHPRSALTGLSAAFQYRPCRCPGSLGATLTVARSLCGCLCRSLCLYSWAYDCHTVHWQPSCLCLECAVTGPPSVFPFAILICVTVPLAAQRG